MRTDYEHLPPAEWTDEEALHHLTGTFDRACRGWPDQMEPYVVLLADAPADEHKSIMRRGLRETLDRRFPLEHVMREG